MATGCRSCSSCVELRLREVAGAGPEPVAGWGGRTIAAGGKRLRPLLVLLSAGAPPADPTSLVRAAVAIELVHAATLIHDDVLDVAALRRGRPTVWAEAGREVATATGDALFARAFAELADNDQTPIRFGCCPGRRPRWRAASCCSARMRGAPTSPSSATSSAAS